MELAGQIREMATRALANEFHSIEPEDARVLLFDGGSCVLGSFAPALTDKATKILQNLGVELHMGVHVTDVRRDGVTVTPKAGGPAEEYRGADRAVDGGRRGRAVRAAYRRGARGHVRPCRTHRGRKPTCRCPGIPRSSSSATSSAATTCRAWPRTPCRAECMPPPASAANSPASARPALPLPRSRLGGLHQPWTRPAAGRPRQALRVHRLAGLGAHPHRISHRRARTASAPSPHGWPRSRAPAAPPDVHPW